MPVDRVKARVHPQRNLTRGWIRAGVRIVPFNMNPHTRSPARSSVARDARPSRTSMYKSAKGML